MGSTLAAQKAENRAHADFLGTPAFGSLDGLRCLSILAVIWHHAGRADNGWRLLDRGFLGVDLFFVISGFLIVTLLLRERAATGGISLRKFYIRRTLRIFPLYYAVILGLAALYATANRHSPFGRQFIADLPFYLTYTANFVTVGLGIVWSLATEEQFYLIWPSIEKYCARMVVPLLLLSILLNQLFNFPAGKALISSFVGGSGWTQLNIFQTTFTPILLGVAAAHLLHSESGFRVCGGFASNRWASTLLFLGLIALISLTPSDISGWPRLALQLGMATWLVSCVYREDHALRPLLTVAPARQIGKISYGMYLFHIQLIVLAAFLLHVDPAHGSLRLFVAGLSITIAAAALSFKYFEGPILKIKSRYSVVHQVHV